MEAQVLDNPVIRADSTEEAQLLELSEQADRGELDVEAPVESQSTIESDPAEPKVGDEPPVVEKTKAVEGERQRDAQGRFTKTEAGVDIPEAERKPAEVVADTKPETPYSKAQKEQKRRDDSWNALNREKEQVRAEAERVRALEAQLRQAPPQVQPNRPQYTSQDMVAAFNDFEARAMKALKEGDYDEHAKNLDFARQAREQAGKIFTLEQRAAQEESAQRFQALYENNMVAAMREDPESVKPESPLSKEIMSLLTNPPQMLKVSKDQSIFDVLPQGFVMAKELAALRLKALSATEAQTANQKLRAELADIQKRTGIRGGMPTAPAAKKDFDSMSLDDQMKALEKATSEADYGFA